MKKFSWISLFLKIVLIFKNPLKKNRTQNIVLKNNKIKEERVTKGSLSY